jgi:hypothetical protein
MSVSDLSVASKLLGCRVGPYGARPVRRSATFQPGFADVRCVGFVGPVWLGEEHQGLGTVYFGRHQSGGGVGVILRPVRVVGNADDIVGRRLHGRGSSLRYSPRQRGDPLPWAGSA